jgi:hypothetical protein
MSSAMVVLISGTAGSFWAKQGEDKAIIKDKSQAAQFSLITEYFISNSLRF